MKRNLFFIVLCILIVVVLGGIKYKQILDGQAQMAAMQMPPTFITSYVVKKEVWTNSIKAVGSLASTEGAMLSAEADARVTEIHFESGKVVNKGDLLVELDASAEKAQLAGARARLELARINLERQKALREKNANSKMDLDNAVSEHDNAVAEVEHLEAVIEKRKVVAPFDGTVGIRLINVGQMVRTGDNIVAIHALDPLYVNFYLPEKDLAKIKIGNDITVKVDPFPNKTFKAKLTAIDSYVDEKTRNVRVQGTLNNQRRLLRSGIFARVEVNLGNERSVYAIPSTAINYNPYGNSVFIIGKDVDETNKTRGINQKFVRVGEKKGDVVEILNNGLKEGDEIASSGIFMLNNSSRVIVNNKIKPSEDLSPNPSNS